uniref:DUF7925 domain-containing protein n=1 Tax=Hassallia byssoidea TaxID=482630 RepID=UPI003013765D
MKNKQSKLYRSLITTLLLANGIFQLVAPALADGTAAGQDISNTATATYKDDSGNDLNATSNTVTVKIAEVAGITITKQNYEDDNGDEVEPGDKLKFKFEIKNVGNDPTKFHIPDKTNVGITNGTVDSLEYSLNGTDWIPINDQDTPSIDAGKSIFVRVNVTVKNDAQADDKVTVTLGNTAVDPNNTELLLQNQQRDTPNENPGDVYTVDNIGTTNGDIDGNPANGVREAGAFQTATVKAKKYALATIFKTKTNYENAGTAKINDDSFTYDLTLKVEGTDTTKNNIIPGTLVGTKINLNGTPDTIRILVSDAIPKDTELASVPTPPTNWIAVYTEDAVTTNANTEQWKTFTAATDLSKVKRIGFVNDPTAFTSIEPNAPEIKFPIKIKVKSDVSKASVTVENIAQIFGQTKDGTTLVYDESGDDRPSNYGDDGSLPPGATDANGDKIPDNNPTVESGYIDNPGSLPESDTDKDNNNSGKGPGGEPNRFVTSNEATVKNGPKDAPEAKGPTADDKGDYTNSDFTNKSTKVPADKSAPGSKFDPDFVTFENTVKNTSTLTNDISLLPTLSAGLPKDTTVTISYGGVDKVYTWDGTNFTIGGNVITSKSDYITIKDVAAGKEVTYTVKVDLPQDTALSTDTGTGFPVAIAAFVDDATPGLGITEPRNITIDRVYTGFLKMVKLSRVLQADGPPVGANQGDFESTPAVNNIDPNPSVGDVVRTPAPGNIIEYQIRYKNISQNEGDGNGNVLLNAKNVEITEDGTGGTNNWAKDNDGDKNLDTTHVSGQAIDTKGSIEYYVGATATTVDPEVPGVTKYVDKVTDQVKPGDEGTFTFQRKVYKPKEPNSPSEL